MIKGKEMFQNELISNYKKWQQIEQKNNADFMRALARDNMRKIKKIFLANFHEEINSFL